MKNLILDLDHTISITENGDYQNSKNVQAIIDKIHYYKKAGFKIVIYSSRNMRTYVFPTIHYNKLSAIIG